MAELPVPPSPKPNRGTEVPSVSQPPALTKNPHRSHYPYFQQTRRRQPEQIKKIKKPTAGTLSISSNSTKAKPLDRPVFWSYLITTFLTCPNWLKWLCRSSFVVSAPTPPTNTLLQQGFLWKHASFAQGLPCRVMQLSLSQIYMSELNNAMCTYVCMYVSKPMYSVALMQLLRWFFVSGAASQGQEGRLPHHTAAFEGRGKTGVPK